MTIFAIKNNKMKFDSSNEFKVQMADEYYNSLKLKKEYIEIRPIKMKRKLDQNGLYWIWLTCIEQETGIDRSELHVLYRANFLMLDDEYVLKFIKKEVWERAKELIIQFHYRPDIAKFIDLISESTTELEIDRFALYLNKIKDHAKNTFNITLVSLEEKLFNDFYKEYYKHI